MDNNRKEISVYVYHGSIVNNRLKKLSFLREIAESLPYVASRLKVEVDRTAIHTV